MHYGQPWPQNSYSGTSFTLPGTAAFADDFHVFAIEKSPELVRWLVDGVVYFERTPADIAPEAWPFNQPFFFLLNVAVGGDWPGSPDGSTIFPSTMEVDYVRVYDNNVFGDLVGPDFVASGATGVTYQVSDGLLDYDYQWSVPPGATITSGDGTSTITVDFVTASSGVDNPMISVTATSATCGATADRTFQMPITMDQSAIDFTFVSAGDEVVDEATLSYASGTYDGAHINPIVADPVNSSPNVVRYVRNAGDQYDVVMYSTSAISDPSVYLPSATASSPNLFKMDIYTTAPVGTTVLLQLENSARIGSGYPNGRHSRYTATIVDGAATGWQRLNFEFLDIPDTSETAADTIVLLFNSNSYTGDTYYFDNLNSYAEGGGSSPSMTPTSAPVDGGGGCALQPLGGSCNGNGDCCSGSCSKGQKGTRTCI